MKDEIHHLPFSSLTPVQRGLDIVNYPIVNVQRGAKNIKSGITKMPVGTVVPGHYHNAEEQVTVLEGKVRFFLGGQEFVCGPYDSTFISANVPHEFMNAGDTPATVLVIYGGPSTTRTFVSTGETVEIGSERDRFPPPPPLPES
jgi:putative monooxygenase